MYANGRGVRQDYMQAYKWLDLAAAGFPTSEAEARDLAVANRDRVAAEMNQAQLAKAQRLAREWGEPR